MPRPLEMQARENLRSVDIEQDGRAPHVIN